MSEAFCDYFGLSVARDEGEAMLDSMRPVLEAAGGFYEGQGLIRFENGGTVKHLVRGPVYLVGTSGQAIAQLKMLDLWGRYLWSIVEGPSHRVTQLHATMDFPVPAPKVVRGLFREAVKGGVRLTRKAVKAAHVEKRFGIDARGDETGTVYLGNRTNDVWAKVYDKRHERECRGYADPGPTLRVEVAVKGKTGISLKDVDNPSAVFYHYASPGLVTAPEDAPAWTPGGSALKLPPKVPLLPAQRLLRLLDASPDIRRAVELAEQIGPQGMDYLYRKLDKMRSQVACEPIGQPVAATG